MDVPADLLAQFRGVTNADETLASQLLRDSGLDLEAAISSFFAIQEAGGIPGASTSPDHSNAADVNDDDIINVDEPPPVRAPIPQMVDTLLPENPYTAQRPAPPQPEPFTEDGTPHGDGLAALFRRPTHLIFSGNFDEAMTAGARQKRWVLVNIQRSTEFTSHTLNRDVWSDPTMEQILQAHFVFWQRDEATEEGSRYKRFYPFGEAPHIAIVDPRSGERVRVWGGEAVNRTMLLTELQDFVTRNSLDGDNVVRGTSRYETSTARPASASNGSARDADAATAGMSEDDQLAAAIAASMEGGDVDMEAVREASAAHQSETPNGMHGADMERQASRLLSATNPALNQSRSLRAQQDNAFEESLALDRAKEESRRDEALRQQMAENEERQRASKLKEVREQKRKRVPEAPPADMVDGVRELMIRLPDGKRLQRRFYATNNVGNVYDFIESEVEGMVEGRFELMQAYPKKSFVEREELLDGLPKKAALVVGLKD